MEHEGPPQPDGRLEQDRPLEGEGRVEKDTLLEEDGPFMNEANRVMLLTPPGSAAIAVVRLVGLGVGAFLQAHFSRQAKTGRAVHGMLRDGERLIDDPVVVLSDEARIADVNLHGGPWVVQSVLELARREGFELIETRGLPLPEEAVDGQTPLEREVLTHLPLARTELALRVLLAQEAAWAELLDAVAGRREGARERVEAVLADQSLWWLLHLPRVAIVGTANVGKSTLANQLFGRERSITADLPGTTRDWVGEIANLDGLAVMLVDTPGWRQTEDPIEQAAIDQSAGQISAAELVVLVLDAAQPIEGGQRALIDAYPNALRVLNKCDAPPAWDLAQIDAVRTVATSGEGIDELRRRIRAHFGCDAIVVAQARWWTEQQRQILQRAAADLS